MIFEPDQINTPVRSLKKRRPDIYQLLLPELESLSPEQPLPMDIPSKYFGQIFQKFLDSFSAQLLLKSCDGEKELVYLHPDFYYNSENKTVSVTVGNDAKDVFFVLETGVHSVFISFHDYPLERAIGTMIRLILALQKHRECTQHV